MKHLIILCSAFLLSISCKAQKSEVKAVKATIESFSDAGAKNNVKKLSPLLDDNFRVVMNQLFGSTEIAVLNKDLYEKKIGNKEFGGEKKSLVFDNVLINGNTACAQVQFKGSKMTFVSLIVLVKDAQGNWKLISDTPIVKA